MTSFDWSSAGATLANFGGEPTTLHVPKTGLPFFDALRLYGAIDLYIGLREGVTIRDTGAEWIVEARSRRSRLAGRDQSAFARIWKKSKPSAVEYCGRLRNSIASGVQLAGDEQLSATKRLDSALQAGIRGTAAASYTTLQTGQTSESTCCVAKIPLSDGLLAFAGMRRVEGVGTITFLPVFKDKVDLSKIVSPLRLQVAVPNPLCAQALALLALRSSLFSEGYQEQFKSVVFNTDFSGQRSDNYSGSITVGSTAVGKMASAEFCAHVYGVFRRLVGRAWKRQGRSYTTTELTSVALALAYWLMQPVPKHLSSMITAEERLRRSGLEGILSRADSRVDCVQEVFEMTYSNSWNGDHDATKKFARAVASGIYYARMLKEDGKEREKVMEARQKVWYDEVTMLRSSPSAKAFIERAMILIEQGHRENDFIGTVQRNEDFDPEGLRRSIGAGQAEFETFRDLFRMYLVQESTHRRSTEPTDEPIIEAGQTTVDASEGEKEDGE